jgi:hypothetical protein
VDKWIFVVIPNESDRTTNPATAHKLFARQRHSVAANTPVESQFRRCRRHFPSVSALPPLTWGLGKGSIDENPSHRGFGFVRVQFAGAVLDVPANASMGGCNPFAAVPSISRRPAWGYAARPRLQSPTRHWAQHPADRPRFATSSEIAAGNRSADNFEVGTDEPTHKGATIMLKSLMLADARRPPVGRLLSNN